MEGTLLNPEGPPVNWRGEEMGKLLLEQAGSLAGSGMTQDGPISQMTKLRPRDRDFQSLGQAG